MNSQTRTEIYAVVGLALAAAAILAGWYEQPVRKFFGVEESPARSATRKKPFENSLGMRFVPVETHNKSAHKVLMSIWETRHQDYEAYADSSEGVNREWKKAIAFKQRVGQEPAHPVVCVSWGDAVAFCKWLTQRERAAGMIGPIDEYRLPKFVEWVAAAGQTPHRKGKRSSVVWGALPPDNGNYADIAFKAITKDLGMLIIENYNDGHATTAPVGSYEPNDLGIYDLGGNVSEWCNTSLSGDQNYKEAMGDSWRDPTIFMPYPSSSFPDFLAPDRGFRCVLEVSLK